MVDNNNKIDFIEIALDCCGYFFLLMFWCFFLLFPILFSIIVFWMFGINDVIYLIVITILVVFSIISSIIPYFISKGIIHRKKIYFLIGILLSIFFLYISINNLYDLNKTELSKILSNLSTLIIDAFIAVALIIGLFSKKIYNKV